VSDPVDWMGIVSDRDAEWRRALRPSGFDDEGWSKSGPKDPAEAAIFVAENERIGEEYCAELNRQHDECEAKREIAESALRGIVDFWERWGEGWKIQELDLLMEKARAILEEDPAQP